jgi:hypothetical protein
MHHLQTNGDLLEMLAEKSAALFFFVDWSEYALRGKDICRQAELALSAQASPDAPSWWTADISSIDSPPNQALHNWLTEQEQSKHMRLVSSIAMGNGSIVWIENGNIVEFETSTRRLGLEELIRRTQKFASAF